MNRTTAIIGSHPLHPQNSIFRVLHIEMRKKGGEWKRIEGSELLSSLSPKTEYELRVLNPEMTIGLGIQGKPIVVPDSVLPLSD